MAKFGLGKGLAELRQDMGNVPDISVLTGTERVAVRQIPLVQIGANPGQPRKTFDVMELEELAASIKEQGVLQPILLREVKGRAHRYEIVAGERRYRASKMAGLAEIPALVKQITDENAMEIALIENVQRENLNALEEAAAYKNLMTACGYEISDVSRLISKSASYIRNMIRLESLPLDVKNMVEQGAISASHARAIAASDNPSKLARQIIGQKLNVADTEKLAKNAKKTQKGRKIIDKTSQSPDHSALEQKIRKKTGLFVKIREKKGGAGDIILSFSTRIQMQEIADKLLG